MNDDDRQALLWERMRDQLRALLRRFGSEDVRRIADFWVDSENWGTSQQKVYVRDLKMLQPIVINAVQEFMFRYPSWEVIISVSVPGMGDAWPDMGLIVRGREIVDELQRQFLPAEFRDIDYSGKRVPSAK